MCEFDDLTPEEVDQINKGITIRNHAAQLVGLGEHKEFKCPICGHLASAGRSVYNGHLWVECKDCEIVTGE